MNGTFLLILVEIQRKREHGQEGDGVLLGKDAEQERQERQDNEPPFAGVHIFQRAPQRQHRAQHGENLIPTLHIGHRLRMDGMNHEKYRGDER